MPKTTKSPPQTLTFTSSVDFGVQCTTCGKLRRHIFHCQNATNETLTKAYQPEIGLVRDYSHVVVKPIDICSTLSR
jgi:hypothetical protein